MLQITAGKYHRRKVLSAEDGSIRPTSAKVREAICNMLINALGEGFTQATVADLCCGSGVMGLELHSRGAASVCFVDHSPRSLAIARENVRHLQVEADCKFMQANCAELPKAITPYTIIMIDAPYHTGLAQQALASALANGWAGVGSCIVVELAAREVLNVPDTCEILRDRTYGATRVVLLEVV